MSSKKKILFLPAWYPNRTNLSIGSFIREHAEIINTHLKVDILHVCGDEDTKTIYNFEKLVVNSVDTYILYYKKSKSKTIISQLLKGLLYVFGQFYAYYLYRKLNPRPVFFHIHVLTRAAILPYVLKLFQNKTTYYITEHWSRYLPQDNSYKGIFRKIITKSIVKRSSGVTAVSEILKLHMKRHKLEHSNFEVISNVARKIFFERNKNNVYHQSKFIHVSNFANCKNVKGILDAFKILQDKGYLFSLTMIGEGDDFEVAKQTVIEYGLNNIEFTGFIYGNEIVDLMENANATLLFSNYETQSIVTMESLSLGIPVIATSVGGIPEMINETNGILVEPNDVFALSRAIAEVITEKVKFDRNKIREEAAQNFKPHVVAQKFMEFYRNSGAASS